MSALVDSAKGRPPKFRWLNRTVFGIGLASLFSDWSHEIATTVLPAFLASMGAAAAWLGLIEGVSDGLSSFAKMASGYYTDKLQRRKPIAIVGYLVTALGTASIGLATAAWQILLSRAGAWLGRGVRTPVRKALLAAAVTRETYGRAFGFERMMDTCGAIVGPATAFVLLAALQHNYRHIFFADAHSRSLRRRSDRISRQGKGAQTRGAHFVWRTLRLLPRPYRKFLVAVGDFWRGRLCAHAIDLAWRRKSSTPELGAVRAASVAVGFYVLRNIFYAGFAYAAGCSRIVSKNSSCSRSVTLWRRGWLC